MNIIKDIEDIAILCKKIECNQRVVQYCTNVYKIYINTIQDYKDRDLLISTSVFIGCKISNYIVDIKNIPNCKEEVVSLELEICKVLDFDFNMEDIYIKVTEFIELYKISKVVAQHVWIFVNDTVYINIDYLDHKSIVIACINLAYIVLDIDKQIGVDENVKIVMNELLLLYELN